MDLTLEQHFSFTAGRPRRILAGIVGARSSKQSTDLVALKLLFRPDIRAAIATTKAHVEALEQDPQHYMALGTPDESPELQGGSARAHNSELNDLLAEQLEKSGAA